jgi:hypothetical protein
MLNNLTNFANIIRERMVKKATLPTDLIALGRADDGYDGGYRPIAISAGNLINQVVDAVNNTGYYTVDLAVTNLVNVNTPKGVIEITMDETDLNPLPAFGSSIGIYIANADMDFTDLDKVYIQFSTYYSQGMGDDFIPYVLSTGGAPTGINLSIFNANPAIAGLGQFTGKFYLYYELYNF